MRKKILMLMLLVALFATACGKEEDSVNNTTTPTPTITEAPQETPSPTGTPEPTATPTPAPTETPEEFEFADKLPREYKDIRIDGLGQVVEVSYETYDYYDDMAPITKPAMVYLPHGYDESQTYPVLYLMHGIGGNEREWGMVNNMSVVACILDNMIANGELEPCIVVTPNGRSYKNFANTAGDHNSFYVFGQELRNDLIPFIESTYSTYAKGDVSPEGLAASRDHRAMAGLSMGGMQTLNIGLCECLDIISYFGAFSSAPTSYTANKIASTIDKDFPDAKINYLYGVCGLQDNIAYAAASGALKTLPVYSDRITAEENFHWQEVPGVHDFNVWYLGFYNFAHVMFK